MGVRGSDQGLPLSLYFYVGGTVPELVLVVYRFRPIINKTI